MIDLVYRNLPVVLVFFTNFLFAWVWGGTRAEPLLDWMPWATFLALQVLLFFPQRHGYEDAMMARERVWRELKRDPLTWLAIVFVLIELVPLVNVGLCRGCDAAAIRAGANPRPPAPFLPFCVALKEHASTLMWFVPAFVAMLAVRHGFVKRGRRLFMEFLVWNGALVACYGFILAATGAKGPYGTTLLSNLWKGQLDFFATFGYPNMAGAFFVMLTACTVGLWLMRVQEARAIHDANRKSSAPAKQRYLWIRAHYLLIPAAVNFFGALATLSRAAIIGAFVVLFAAFGYLVAGMFSGKRRDRIRSVKTVAWSALGLLVFLFAVYVFAPSGMSREVHTISTTELLDRLSGKSQYHTHVATEIFKDYPFFGVGGWGYRHFCSRYLKPDERKRMQIEGGANVHNDYVQFLCEYGSVGFGLLVTIVVLLLLPVMRDWYHFYHDSKFTRPGDEPITTTAVYALPAPIFWIFVGSLLVALDAMGDCPLRSGAVLSTLLTSLAAADGFLPDKERKR